MTDQASYEPMVLLGRYARRARALAGFGQRLLAVKAGVSQSAVARLELGRAAGMPTGRLMRIAGVLDRKFPIGVCPHTHRCAWQPIEPPQPLSDRDLLREEIVERGLDSLPLWMRD